MDLILSATVTICSSFGISPRNDSFASEAECKSPRATEIILRIKIEQTASEGRGRSAEVFRYDISTNKLSILVKLLKFMNFMKCNLM